jgi:hypothetical protein
MNIFSMSFPGGMIMYKYLFTIIILSTILFSCSPSETSDAGPIFVPKDPPAGWPNSTNTGLTNPSALTSSDAVTITDDNTTIENLEINGLLTIDADDVTVQNCRIWGDVDNGILIKSGTGIVIKNNVIGRDAGDWPNGQKGITMKYADPIDVEISSNYIRYVDDGIFIGTQTSGYFYTVLIKDNYITYVHSNDYVAGDSVHDHKGDGIEVLGGVSNSTVDHNSIEAPLSQTSCILFQSHWFSLENITISNNWLNGGSYPLKTRVREETFSNLTIINNRLGRDYLYGVWDAYEKESITSLTVSGNVWDDTGELAFE